MINGELVAGLRRDIAGWTRAAIAADLGERALAALDRDIPVPAAVAATGTRIALQTRLFWLGESLSDGELTAALPNTARVLASAHEPVGDLLTRTADGWRSRWQIAAVDVPAHLAGAIREANPDSLASTEGTVWIASTPGALRGARHGSDFVMGVGGASRTLAALAGYRAGQHVLDLGTGSGIHGILAALAGAQVTATDVSAPALELAAFNAALNGICLDLRRGSLYEPVVGERFDVIVSNPPFVITPRAARTRIGTLEYRDAGMAGDDLSARVVEGLAEHLTADGRAWMLINWEIPAADSPGSHGDGALSDATGGPGIGTEAADPYARLRTWASNLDVHVIMRDQLPVTSYIETWLADGGLRPGCADYVPAYRAWLADFDERQVTHVGMGYLMAGRPPAERPASVADPTDAPATPVFLGQYLRGAAPANLHEYMTRQWDGRNLTLAELVRLAPTATDVVEHRFYYPGHTDPWIIKFTQTSGFGEEILADTALAGFVSVADGELSTGQIIAALAELLSEEPDTLAARLLPEVVRMKQLGMLTFDYPLN